MEIYENLSLESLPNEEWRDVVGYEGLYQVSNLGRVKGITHYVKAPQGKRLVPTLIKKPDKMIDGYLHANLWRDNKKFSTGIHRLVAIAFIPNPNNLPDVNHKDEDKRNNNVSNLEWCTVKYNNNYGTRIERQRQKMINRESMSKKVLQYSNDGTFIEEYPSAREAARQLGLWNANISLCCRGKIKSYNGYIFKYK